jgi:hypothetical protein
MRAFGNFMLSLSKHRPAILSRMKGSRISFDRLRMRCVAIPPFVECTQWWNAGRKTGERMKD